MQAAVALDVNSPDMGLPEACTNTTCSTSQALKSNLHFIFRCPNITPVTLNPKPPQYDPNINPKLGIESTSGSSDLFLHPGGVPVLVIMNNGFRV